MVIINMQSDVLAALYISLDISVSKKTGNLLILLHDARFNYRLAIGVHCYLLAKFIILLVV